MTYRSDRPLEMDVVRQGPGAVLKMHGSARMADAEAMRTTLEDLTEGQATPIILDMTDLDFICSIGLGAIISGHLRTRHYEGRVCLVSPKPSVMELLETTRLTKLFPIFPTVEQAMA
jgi:anti-sigma B factor antagonist